MNNYKVSQDQKQRLLAGIGVPEKQDFVVDDFQREAIEAIALGKDTLVVAPTGSGKTYIALEAIKVALGLKQRAIYTTPLKALSNGKYNELKRIFEPEFKVGLLTGDRKIDTDADIVVATTEIYRNELYRDPGRYAVIILDEVHYLADLQRGPVWEESIILSPKDSALLMLSASISNIEEISAWLEDVRGRPCHVVIKQNRPVELRLGFLHPGHGILPLHDEQGQLLKEVSRFYAGVRPDPTGRRLVGGPFGEQRDFYRGSGGGRGNRGNNSNGGGSDNRGSGGRRSGRGRNRSGRGKR